MAFYTDDTPGIKIAPVSGLTGCLLWPVCVQRGLPWPADTKTGSTNFSCCLAVVCVATDHACALLSLPPCSTW